ncbi:hypothetical protein S101446_03285 (plasmid) [Komagataeibacter europaeus]|nr:hypothetical protein S101446_03285 [Komagataeibacter europaeus]
MRPLERGGRLLEQSELELEDLETAIAEDNPANAPATMVRASETGVERQRQAPVALPHEPVALRALCSDHAVVYPVWESCARA